MYETFYGFKEKPFSMLPDPGFLYLSKKHQTALTLLEYGLLNHVGFCVISGDPGAGKTTILRAVLDHVSDDVTVGLITNTHQSFGGLLDWVLSVFDLHRPGLTHVEMHQILMEFLIEEYAQNRTVLLIVDEAQNMSAESLEELRMLSNVNSEKDQLLQIVLAGQPALKELLRKPELMQFAQRIAVDYHLDPLSAEETCGYIQHRLRIAGAQTDVFTPAACERIHSYSGGTPRLINLLCETVLVYGFADQQEQIDVDLVDEMVQERMKDSVVPIVNRDAAQQDHSAAVKKLEETFPWIETPGIETPGIETPGRQHQPIVDKTAAEKVAEQPVAKPADSAKQPVSKAKPSPPKKSKLAANFAEMSAEREKPPVVNKPASAGAEVKSASTPVVKQEPVQAETDKVTPRQDATTIPTLTQAAKDNSAEKAAAQVTGQAADRATEQITGSAIPPAGTAGKDNTGGQMLKYSVVAIFLGVVLVLLAMVLSAEDHNEAPVAIDEKTSQQKLQAQEREAKKQSRIEEQRIAEVQRQAEAQKAAALEEESISKERQAAQRKLEAEKQAAEEQRIANEKEAKQTAVIAAQKAEQGRIAKQKAAEAQRQAHAQAQRQAQQKAVREQEQARRAKEKARQEREARYAAERERRKAAKLAEERQLKEQEEARRLEREWLETQRRTQAKKTQAKKSQRQLRLA